MRQLHNVIGYSLVTAERLRMTTNHRRTLLLAAASLLIGCHVESGDLPDGMAPTDGSPTSGATDGGDTTDSAEESTPDDGAGEETNDTNPDEPQPGDPASPVMDCPTAEAPEYTAASRLQGASSAFSVHCSSCHGRSGGGRGIAPPIRNYASLDAYRTAVRSGKGTMPAFSDDVISDDQLAADFEALLGDAPPAFESTGIAEPSTWTDAEVQEKLAAGLVAWRTPDAEGAACANCHTPDALGLAVIGYSDLDIRRRGLGHLEPDQIQSIVDMVHAQRRRYEIDTPCDRDQWRPMQPGGLPLEGDTRELRDLAFSKQFAEVAPLVATGEVRTLEDAQHAASEWTAINPRRMRSTVLFPRWTEDRFFGPEHATVNDWLLETAMVPDDPAEYFAMVDAYLDDPSDRNLNPIIMDFRDHSSFPGTSVEEPTRLLSRKRWTQWLAQHSMRLELLGEPGLFDRKHAPFEGFYQPIGEEQAPNPFWLMGRAFINIVVGCRDLADQSEALRCMGFTEPMVAEFEASGMTSANEYWSAASHPWFMMNFTWEPPGVGRSEARGFKYWKVESLFEAFYVHANRVVATTLSPEDVEFRWFKSPDPDDVPPLLNGTWIADFFGNGPEHEYYPTEPPDPAQSSETERQTYKAFVVASTNTYIMLTHLIREALEERPEVANKATLIAALEGWRDFVTAHVSDPQIDALFADLLSMVQAAPELYEVKEAYGPYCDDDLAVECAPKAHHDSVFD